MATAALTVRQLRHNWKPWKERNQSNPRGTNTNIRMHRAFSWLSRADECDETGDNDVKLMCLWIAFNALYNQWDASAREPKPDRLGWSHFISRIAGLDKGGLLGAFLLEQQSLVYSILESEHLNQWFWEDPNATRAAQAKKARRVAPSLYLEHKWASITEYAVDRVYLLRCQLVHGAASVDSQLNREPLEHCTRFLRGLVSTTAMIIIENGASEDWGLLCYPPLGDGRP